MIRSLDACHDFLSSHIHDEPRQRGTQRISNLLSKIGNPQKNLPIIHVGGTAGKASTVLLTASILETQGFHVGAYTKPHLMNITERMCINHIPISEHLFISYCNRIQPICETITRTNPEHAPSYSEILLAIALWYFHESHVDCAVIEVGIGGMHDATNILTSRVSILTNVGKAHTHVLGKTLREIAVEKIGIMKPHVPFVTSVTQPSVIALINEKHRAIDAPIFVYANDFSATHIRLIPTMDREKIGYQQFDYQCKAKKITNIMLSLRGAHQVKNAALAITAARLFTDVSDTSIRTACATFSFPGRNDVVSYYGKTLIMDGAHNPTKMRAFVHTVCDMIPNKKFPLYIPLKHNDDMTRMLPILTPIISSCIFVRFDNPSAKDTDMEQHLSTIMNSTLPSIPFSHITLHDLPSHFLTQKGDTIGVVGSLTLIGIIREKLSVPWSLTQHHI